MGLVSGVPPTAPADVIATAENSQAFLNWLPSPGAAGYNVKRSTVSGSPYSTNLANVTYADNGLANGTYYYVISALNAVGESGNSSQVYAMPGTLSRTTWVASSSTTGSDQPDNALDGDLSTRWSTGASQANGQWFQVDMGATNVFNKLVLNSANSPNDYPRGYQVFVSNDGVNWTGPVATGTGSVGTTTINFATQAARYIRIVQTGSVSGTFWSIHEFNVFAPVPFALSFAVNGAQLQLTWPADHLGWRLEMQTNSLSAANWITVPNSSATNQISLPIRSNRQRVLPVGLSVTNVTLWARPLCPECFRCRSRHRL